MWGKIVLRSGRLIPVILIAAAVSAQDPGTIDTVRVEAISGDVYGDISVPVTLYNDEELSAILIPVVINGYSGWMRFDSISYTGGRLEGGSILPEREAFVYVTDTFSVEAFVVRFSISSGDPLPAGDGTIFDIWFSPLFGGDVLLDSMAVSPYGSLKLSDGFTNDFVPEFQSGAVSIACDYEIGDVRFDGAVNIIDWMGFWKQYYGCQEALAPYYIADVNCDRRVDMRDLNAIWQNVYFGGEICNCGSYSPGVYHDPGAPDTLWIESDTLYLGVMDTIDVKIVHDEYLSCWGVGLYWDGSAVLNLDHSFGYGGGYLCVDYEGNPGYVCPYVYQNFDNFPPGDSIIARLPFTPVTPGTATITMGNLSTGPESMYVTADGEAVIPVAVGGEITVLPRPCGDANRDGDINVGDVIFIVNYVFKGGPGPDPECIGDANGDTVVNISDGTYLIGFIFKGGSPPVDDCCR